MKTKILFILITIFLFNLGFRIFEYRSEYLSKFNPSYWEKRYELSQWGNKKACDNLDPHINPFTCQWDDNWESQHKYDDQTVLKKNNLGDDGLYTYVGWKYINGSDPTLLNAEVPPLGKYLIGLSALIFGNENIFALLSGILVLVSLFYLNKIIFKNNFLGFLPVFLFSFDRLFYTQLQAPFLDLLYLEFLILTFIFFLKKKFWLSAIFLGAMMATKASATTFVIVMTSILVYWSYMNDKDKLKKIFLYIPISLITFLTTYIVFFLKGHDIIEFLKVQKWILNFYANGARGDPSAALQILFTGSWPTWWGEVIKVNEWTLLWPLSVLVTIYYLYIVLIRRKLYPSVLFAIWIIVYLVFLTFVPVWPRYLLLLLPFMYTLFVWVLTNSRHVFKSKV